MRHGGGAAQLSLLILACATVVGTQSAAAFSLPYSDRIRLSGFIDYTGQYNKSAISDSSINNSTTVRLNAASYLWRPWVALIDGSIGLTFSARSNGTEHTGRTITGGGNLSLFPKSSFPMSAFFQRFTSVIEGDVTGPDLISTSFGFNQSLSGYFGSNFNLAFQRTLTSEESKVSNIRDRDDTDDNLEFSASRRYEDHTFNLDSTYDRLARTFPAQTNDRFLQLLRHSYRPGSDLTVNNLLTYNNRTNETLNNETASESLQANSNAFWRPETEKPLLITANALFRSQTTTVGSNSSPTNRNASLATQASYQWSPHFNYRALANLSVNQSRGDNQVSTAQGLGVDYSPAEKMFFGFNYSYNLSADARNNTNQAGSQQSLSSSAGHVFTKYLPLLGGSFNMSASQRGSTLIDSAGSFNRTITHTLSNGWSRSAGASSSFMRLTLSDSRRSGSDEGGLQLANFQSTHDQRLSRDSSWNGNLTFQVSRPLQEDADEVTMSSSINFSYNQRRVFGVRRLNLATEVGYLTNSLFNIVNSDGLDTPETNESFWRNRLNYSIGRLTLSLNANLAHSDDGLNTSLLFQARRGFGN